MSKFIEFFRKYYFEIFIFFIISFFGFSFAFYCFNYDFKDIYNRAAMYEKISIKEFGTTFDSYESYLYYKIYGK